MLLRGFPCSEMVARLGSDCIDVTLGVRECRGLIGGSGGLDSYTNVSSEFDESASSSVSIIFCSNMSLRLLGAVEVRFVFFFSRFGGRIVSLDCFLCNLTLPTGLTCCGTETTVSISAVISFIPSWFVFTVLAPTVGRLCNARDGPRLDILPSLLLPVSDSDSCMILLTEVELVFSGFTSFLDLSLSSTIVGGFEEESIKYLESPRAGVLGRLLSVTVSNADGFDGRGVLETRCDVAIFSEPDSVVSLSFDVTTAGSCNDVSLGFLGEVKLGDRTRGGGGDLETLKRGDVGQCGILEDDGR